MQSLSITVDPLVPVWVIALLALPALAAIAFALASRMRAAWLRLGALAALVLALVNPVLLNEDRVPQPTVVAIVADDSQSQALDGRDTRTQAIVEGLQERLARFPQFDVRTVTATRDNADAGASTRLFETLRGALRDVPPARIGGAIFVTDGQVHDVPTDMAGLGFDAPLHGLITGREGEFDRRLALIQAPRFSIVGQPLVINYRIIEQGDAPEDGQLLDVFIFRNGELVATERTLAGVESSVQLELDRAGKNIIEMEVVAADDELTDTNNRAIVRLDGIRENLRVLLVSGEPHSGERTWRNLLKSDASVDLVHFTILRPPEKQDGTPINELSLIAFPTRELFVEKIDDFDLIIFDRYQNRNVLPILYYDYITQYVRGGGALLIAAGPEFAGIGSIAETPLMNALPALPTGTVTEAGFVPAITDDGMRHPVTRDLASSPEAAQAWGRWFRTIDIGETDGNVVMRGADDKPLLVLERIGEGRVGLLLSDHGWLWARGFEGGGPYLDLYRRTAHWLMREPELEEERLTAEGDGDTLTITRQTMAEEAGEAVIVGPTGEETTVSPVREAAGRFTARVPTEEIGLYTITNGDRTALASIGPVDAPEFRDMISTPDQIGPLAETTGGTARRIVDADGSLDIPNIVPVRSTANASGRDWIGLLNTRETQLVGIDRQPLFAGFLGLALLLMILAGTWWREGR